MGTREGIGPSGAAGKPGGDVGEGPWDWRAARELAFGPLGLTHEQFFRLTPRELWDLANGFEWRHRRELMIRALFTANLMNASGNMKRRVKPKDLLGPKFFLEKEKDTKPAEVDWVRQRMEFMKLKHESEKVDKKHGRH